MGIAKEASEMNGLRKKVLKDIEILLKKQAAFYNDINRKFRTEYNRNSKSMDHLEDFYHLNHLCKKNLQSVKTAHNLVVRMDDLSRFEIEEEDIVSEILSSTTKG